MRLRFSKDDCAGPNHNWAHLHSRRRNSLKGPAATVEIGFESGKVDINHADVALLAAVFQAAGVPTDRVESASARITRWRGESSSFRGSDSGSPITGRLESIDELRGVTSMDAANFECVAPYLTVFSQSMTPDIAHADPVVASAMLKAGYFGSAQIPIQASTEGASRSVVAGQSGSAGQLYNIRALVRGGSEPGLIHDAVVRLTGNTRDPILVYAWGKGIEKTSGDHGCEPTPVFRIPTVT